MSEILEPRPSDHAADEVGLERGGPVMETHDDDGKPLRVRSERRAVRPFQDLPVSDPAPVRRDR